MASKSIAIHIKPETWERCKHFGIFGDSQDDLLNRVIDLAGKYTKMEYDLVTTGHHVSETPDIIKVPPAPVVKEPPQEYKTEEKKE